MLVSMCPAAGRSPPVMVTVQNGNSRVTAPWQRTIPGPLIQWQFSGIRADPPAAWRTGTSAGLLGRLTGALRRLSTINTADWTIAVSSVLDRLGGILALRGTLLQVSPELRPRASYPIDHAQRRNRLTGRAGGSGGAPSATARMAGVARV